MTEFNVGPGNRMIEGAEDSPKSEYNTHHSIMIALRKEQTGAFRNQLTGMIRPAGRGGFTKKQVEDMVAGFEDGFRAALCALREMQILKVDDSK